MSVFRRQSINPHLDEVVKVVLPPYPAIAGLQTVGLVGDVFRVQAFTVVELPFEQLESQIEKERERERSAGLLGCHLHIISIAPELATLSTANH